MKIKVMHSGLQKALIALVLFSVFVAFPARSELKNLDLKTELLVSPLSTEAGPVLSLPVDAVPKTQLKAQSGVKYSRETLGRAEYKIISTRIVVGGEWAPKALKRRFSVAADLVAFQSNTIKRSVPPVIDETNSYFDLGIARLNAKYVAFFYYKEGAPKWPFQIVLTPFFRLSLPTDTSRLRPDRWMPIRRVLDDRVFESPYM